MFGLKVVAMAESGQLPHDWTPVVHRSQAVTERMKYSVYTHAERQAAAWLKKRGGAGTVDYHGHIWAEGEVNKDIRPATWLKLVQKGVLVGLAGRPWLSKMAGGAR
jgi:hypothetical protein